jgi:hypothetical protein
MFYVYNVLCGRRKTVGLYIQKKQVNCIKTFEAVVGNYNVERGLSRLIIAASQLTSLAI